MRGAVGLGIVFALIVTAGCRGEAGPKRQTGPNPGSMGFMDAPKPEAIVGPIFTVAGWAIDESGVERVRIYIDDELITTAPLTIMRPDVEAAYAAKTVTGTPHGFTVVIDAGTRAGFHTIRLEALDGRGALTQVATTNFRIEP
jgi:hypothetical protein